MAGRVFGVAVTFLGFVSVSAVAGTGVSVAALRLSRALVNVLRRVS
jgi:hypothetical protein